MVAQQFDIALGLLAEGKVAACHHAVRAKTFEQDVGDEILGARPSQFAIKVEHQHRGGPCGEIKLLPLFERRQAERRHIGLEEAHRMRVEGRDDRRAALRLRPVDRLARHRLMPAMEAVEIAERNHSAAQRLRDLVSVIEPSHCAALIGLSPACKTRSALRPMAARISSSLKPSSISACVTCVSCDVSKRTVTAPS